MQANLQYGWTLFVAPIDAKFHWGRAAIQVAFSAFVFVETWLIPIEGYLVDRFGPRAVVMGGAYGGSDRRHDRGLGIPSPRTRRRQPSAHGRRRPSKLNRHPLERFPERSTS